MSKKISWRVLGIIFFVLLISFSYQNCGPGFQPGQPGEGQFSSGNPPPLGPANFSVEEGESSGIDVELPRQSFDDLIYEWTVSSSGADEFVSSSGEIAFAAGELVQSFALQALVDGDFEGNQRFEVRFRLISGQGPDLPPLIVEVVDGNQPPIVAIGNVAVTEGMTAYVPVRLSSPIEVEARVDIGLLQGGSAQAGSDVDSSLNSAVFLPGETEVLVPFTVFADNQEEPLEAITIVVVSAENASVNNNFSRGYIDIYSTSDFANNVIPVLSNGVAKEGSPVPISVTLNKPAPSEMKFVLQVSSNQSSLPGVDFAGGPITIVIPEGETSESADFVTMSDDMFEGNEQFRVSTTSATFGSRTIATAMIANDDLPPRLELASESVLSVKEGQSAKVVVELSSVSGLPVRFQYRTRALSAEAGADYTEVPLTLVTIATGVESLTLAVSTTNDTVGAEGREQFFIEFSEPVNTRISAKLRRDLVVNIKAGTEPDLYFADVNGVRRGFASSLEGNNIVFAVTMSRVAQKAVSFQWRTRVLSPRINAAVASSADFVSARGIVSIPPGQLRGEFAIKTKEDNLFEFNLEKFEVDIITATNGEIGQETADGYIDDDEIAPPISISGGVAAEGSRLPVVLSLGNAIRLGRPIYFLYQTVDAGTAQATAGLDYTPIATASMAMNPGQSQVTLLVPTKKDSVDEATEFFGVRFTNLNGFELLSGTSNPFLARIVNRDPEISVSTSSVSEGSPLTFTLQLSFASLQAVSLQAFTSLYTGTGDAAEPSDFTALGSAEAPVTVSFPAGVRTRTITVNTANDSTREINNELLKLNLINPKNAKFTGGRTSVSVIGSILSSD